MIALYVNIIGQYNMLKQTSIMYEKIKKTYITYPYFYTFMLTRIRFMV